MNKHVFLAVDIGATSGRAMAATLEGGDFRMEEIHRFSNNMLLLHDKYYWDIFHLYRAVRESLRICVKKGIKPDSIGIDTWGVDFGYIGEDGTILGLPRSYRDPYTSGAAEEFSCLMPSEEVYSKTGIQFMDFNSLFQLFRAKKCNSSLLKAAKKILFTPDLLAYMLTGKMVCEYTIASTSQLLNPVAKEFDRTLFEAAGISPGLMAPLTMPGTVIGLLADETAKETGIGKIPVIAVAGHDTASAIVAVPATVPEFAYLSSGTWSLMGIETEEPIITGASFANNFTNEGGIEGTTRFLKNITGMWLLEQCRKEWEREGKSYTYGQLTAMAAQASNFASIVNPDDASFTCPASMPEAIAAYCIGTGQAAPLTDAEYVFCIFNSLAHRYKEMIALLDGMASFKIKKLHIIGGGSQNKFLNQLVADTVRLEVIAGPSEATATGNCLIQAKAAGLVADRWEIRKLVISFFQPETYYPKNI
ncbi:MAG: rhamnulokinase [Tannerellaceae bacterium]|jgi:rhamnulokinase|nr:rhamnulokinase [Tannerellaceae bacterium]